MPWVLGIFGLLLYNKSKTQSAAVASAAAAPQPQKTSVNINGDPIAPHQQAPGPSVLSETASAPLPIHPQMSPVALVTTLPPIAPPIAPPRIATFIAKAAPRVAAGVAARSMIEFM